MKLPLFATAFAGLAAATLSVSGAALTAQAGPGQTETLSVIGCVRENPARAGAYLLDSIESASAEKSYRLIGSATADLKPHVGQKVKVTGTVAKAPRGGDGPAMNVTTVNMIADSCPAVSR